MLDRYNRHINSLRISVTDRCNMRCIYCMPEDGVQWIQKENILSYEEIFDVVKTAVSMGIDKIRLTGGEPLVRKDIVKLVKMIASVNGVKDLALTTNGVLLTNFALPLKEAGLMRVNVSLDTLDENKFRSITRGGELTDVLKGITAAQKASLFPVKINCVLTQNHTEKEKNELGKFADENNIQLRYIHQMNLKSGYFRQVINGNGGHCAHCNRLRLTANGMIKPCLFSELNFNIRQLGIYQAITAALEHKPLKGTTNKIDRFNKIGG